MASLDDCEGTTQVVYNDPGKFDLHCFRWILDFLAVFEVFRISLSYIMGEQNREGGRPGDRQQREGRGRGEGEDGKRKKKKKV